MVRVTGRGERSGRLLTRFTFVFDIFTNDARAGRDREFCFLLFFFCCCSCFAAHKCLLFISALRAQFDFPITAQRKKKPAICWPLARDLFFLCFVEGGGGAAHSTLIVCVFVCGWELVWQGSRVYFPIFFIHTLKLHTPLRARFTIEWVRVCVCVFVWWCDLRLLFEVKINSLKVVLRMGGYGRKHRSTQSEMQLIVLLLESPGMVWAVGWFGFPRRRGQRSHSRSCLQQIA